MGGLADSIGSIAVEITGDYSELQSALDDAAHYAEQSAEQIADAFNTAGSSADEAAPQVENLGEKTKEAGDKAKESESAFSELGDKVLDLATELGVVIGLAEGIKETFSAFAEVESATVALTALTGSAAIASEQIEQLEQMAVAENLSFPALLEANQRMVAFGFSLEDIPAALQAAADAAAALNSNVAETANAIDRMAASGMAGARQLVSLGLTTADLATVMGVAEEDVKKAFAALDQEPRLEVLTAALAKFAGQSQVAADTLKGQWQGVKNTFEAFFVTLGNFLEPLAKQILTWFQTIARAAEAFVLAIQVNLEKLEFYFEKFTGQVDAANAKAQEINANAAKFRALVEGGTPSGPGVVAGKMGGASDIADLQARIAAELAAKEAVDQLSQAQRDLNARTQEQINYGDILKDQLADLQKEHDDYAKAAAAAGGETQLYTQQLNSFIAGLSAIPTIEAPVVDTFGRIGDATKSTGDLLNEMAGKVKPPFDALHDLIMRIDEDLASGNYAGVERIINRLAVDDLPTAVAQQERYVEALQQANVPADKLLAAQRTLLDLQLQLASRNIFPPITAAVQAMGHALDQVGNSFAKLIVEGGNFGKMMRQLFIQVAETILSTLMNALIKMGEQFVIQKLLEHTTTAATNVAAVTSAAGVAFANTMASISAIPIIGPAMAPGIAAATAAETLAGGLPLASAAEGAVFGADTLVQAHAEEMILPASLSNGLQDLIQNNRTGGSSGNGLTIAIQNMHGVTRDTVDALATQIVRKARLAGAFR